MRFFKEVVKQMASDVNDILQGYGAITLYSFVTIAIMFLTANALGTINWPNTTLWRGIGALTFLFTLVGELALAAWIWNSAKLAREKIDKENKELLKSIKGDPETYR